ncbi:hypothetical protein HDE_14118 [Halotydeus destructor]|nr:hypothetical protein HDE_14118 [Halotydeus destructor]
MVSPSRTEDVLQPEKTNKLLVGTLLLVGVAIIGGSYLLVSNGLVRLGGATKAASLSSFSAKAEFTVRYWILPLFWLVLALLNVVRARDKGNALNPLVGNEHRVQSQKNIMTNSIEQTLFTFGVQLSMLPYLTGEEVITVIPLINVLFFAGRILFAIGYPNYRGTGFAMTYLPSFAACFWTMYKFQREHLELY